jgi:hypothetical protein
MESPNGFSSDEAASFDFIAYFVVVERPPSAVNNPDKN